MNQLISYPMCEHSLGAHWRMWRVCSTKHIYLIHFACISIVSDHWGCDPVTVQMVPGLVKLWCTCTQSAEHDWITTRSLDTIISVIMCSFMNSCHSTSLHTSSP